MSDLRRELNESMHRYAETYLVYRLPRNYGCPESEWVVYKLEPMKSQRKAYIDEKGKRRSKPEVLSPPSLFLYAKYKTTDMFLADFPLDESSFSAPECLDLFKAGTFPMSGPFVIVKVREDDSSYYNSRRGIKTHFKVIDHHWEI
jgi:hypothetical protein